jgi:hypothetical protein
LDFSGAVAKSTIMKMISTPRAASGFNLQTTNRCMIEAGRRTYRAIGSALTLAARLMKTPAYLRYAIFGIIFLISGCAGSSGIIQLSNNTYMVSRTSAAGAFADMSNLKASVIREANQFAESKGKVAVAKASHETIPAHGFPSYEYQFILLDKNDPRANDVSLLPRPDVVIQKTENIKNDSPAPTAPIIPADLYNELMKLDDLRKRGILTDAEFEAQKQKLLGESR